MFLVRCFLDLGIKNYSDCLVCCVTDPGVTSDA